VKASIRTRGDESLLVPQIVKFGTFGECSQYDLSLDLKDMENPKAHEKSEHT
jgi:hypothetical protein